MRRAGGGKVDWRTLTRVLDAGGVVCAVSVATCARVRTRGVVLIKDSGCRRHAVRCFRARIQFMGWVGRVGVLLVVSLGLCTLRTDGYMLIVHIILRFNSVWGGGMSAIVCTLGTCCPLWLSVSVAACSNCLGCALCVLVLRQLCVGGPAWPEKFCLCLSCRGWL